MCYNIIMHTAVASHAPQIAMICQRYGVMQLEVFGSAARGGDFDIVTSDADFLVQFGKADHLGPLEQFFGLREELEHLLGRPVDLIEANAVKNPIVRAAIEASKEMIYAAR